MKRRESLQVLEKLLSTTQLLLQTAPNFDPQVRADYEVASRAAKDYLPPRRLLDTARSFAGRRKDRRRQPQLNAVILNIGKTLE